MAVASKYIALAAGMVRNMQNQNRDFCLPYLHFTSPLGVGSSRNIAMPFGTEKREWYGYPVVKMFLKISLFVLTECTNVTDTQTDGRTPHDG